MSDTRAHEWPDFCGTERFVVEACLGRGGMGVVYRAYDRERRIPIALKTVLRRDPATLYQFKKEFRALSDVVHPNLASLYELHTLGDQWFFTMELVSGIDFLAHVRGESARRAQPALARGSESTQRTITMSGWARAAPQEDAPAVVDYQRLRDALRQLVAGICALHDSGHLHRDIKPSNVLVTADGRVVVLDFGIITEQSTGDAEPGVTLGTPAYMSPELLAPRGRSSQASDWYSVGVMLYQALAGRRPVLGPTTDIPGIRPAGALDLDRLCMDLLQPDPAARPRGADILQRLAPAQTPTLVASTRPDVLFVSRESQLDTLRRAHATARTGSGRIVYVHGVSGMGKTALVQRFLREVQGDARAVVLAGRCYQRESVPYKAVDSLIDSLTRFLVGLPLEQVVRVLPADVQLLARLFPVLRRVEAIARMRRAGAASPDPHELRRRAFAALRELLARVAADRPVVLFIDDLQWGDSDSAPLLDGLMRPPDAPGLLLLACYRTADATKSPLLQAMFRRHARLGPSANSEHVAVDILPPESADELAAALLASAGAGTEAAAQLASEAAGNPFFLHELVKSFVSQPSPSPHRRHPPDLDQVIMARVDELSVAARRLLELTAVAARPIALAVVRAASRMDEAQGPEPMKVLAAGHLVRLAGSRDDDVIETFHDRIRETVVGHLTAETMREHHLNLALALEAAGNPDAETLCEHFHGAGMDEVAADYAVQAADQAARALAFGRAASLYERARTLTTADPVGRRTIEIKLADALANAGRSAEAADLYLALAEGVSGGEALTFKRLAADHYLRAGVIDQGLTALETVLDSVGYRLPKTPNRALLSLLSRRLVLRVRGLGFRTREETRLPGQDLARIDACWITAEGLALVDTIRGADFQCRGLLCALRAGEPHRIARSLLLETCYSSVSGWRGRRRAFRVFETAGRLVAASDRPDLRALAWGAAAFAHYQGGEFAEALSNADSSIQAYRDHCSGVTWEVMNMEIYRIFALFYLGELGKMAAHVQRVVEEARQRGDLYTWTILSTGLPSSAWLASHDVDGCERSIAGAMERWSERGYHLQHYWQMFALAQCDLYRGDAAAAHRRVELGWDGFRGSLLTHIEFVRSEAVHLRARAMLAAAARDSDRAQANAAVKLAGKLERTGTPWTQALAALVRAGGAAAGGDIDGAATGFAVAAEACAATGMQLYSAAARHRRGELVGGGEGAALIAEASAWMNKRGVRQPAALAGMLAPGLPPSP